MLLDKEKDGTGPKRLTRAVAFIEAAGRASQMAIDCGSKGPRQWLDQLADEFTDMAYKERRAFDDEQARAKREGRDV